MPRRPDQLKPAPPEPTGSQRINPTPEPATDKDKQPAETRFPDGRWT